jgi:xylose isomerase
VWGGDVGVGLEVFWGGGEVLNGELAGGGMGEEMERVVRFFVLCMDFTYSIDKPRKLFSYFISRSPTHGDDIANDFIISPHASTLLG